MPSDRRRVGGLFPRVIGLRRRCRHDMAVARANMRSPAAGLRQAAPVAPLGLARRGIVTGGGNGRKRMMIGVNIVWMRSTGRWCR